MASGGTSQAMVPRSGLVNTRFTPRMKYGKCAVTLPRGTAYPVLVRARRNSSLANASTVLFRIFCMLVLAALV